ncbi:MAG: hypothetical protein MAGBODY4_00886 [Candidatus Marinimicrobia bacterium]|nr:hypothetical protein [Candidatus Neomarinimicrobiota bacterium]
MRKIFHIVVFLIFFPTIGFAQDNLDISGYYKNFSVIFNPHEYNSAPDHLPGYLDQHVQGMVTNRLRITAEYQISDNIRWHGSYNFVPRVQDSSFFKQSGFAIPSVDKGRYRAYDINRKVYPYNRQSGSVGIYQNLDRAFVSLALPNADVYIGRQPIAWGSARVINPTDIIAPFTYDELDTEERTGVDAIRVRIPLGFMGEFDFGYVAGKKFVFDRSAVFARTKFYAMETDVSLLLLKFQEHLMAGADFARSLGDAGFWLEAAYVLNKPFEDFTLQNVDNYFRGSVGLDYSFSGETYGFIEYHYNDAGVKDNKDYSGILLNPPAAYEDGAVYLLGKSYLAPGISYQYTPLVTLAGQALYNTADRSMFLSPSLEYNIAQNVYFDLGAFFGIGKRAVISEALQPVLRSEFGTYPDIYYASFRLYF